MSVKLKGSCWSNSGWSTTRRWHPRDQVMLPVASEILRVPKLLQQCLEVLLVYLVQELHDEEYGEWLTKEEKFHLDNAKAQRQLCLGTVLVQAVLRFYMVLLGAN